MTSEPGAHNKIWDTHVHLFDPVKHPYKPDRAYTPPSASAAELIRRSPANNFMLVQATIESDSSALLDHLQTLSHQFPGRKFRGTILFGQGDVANAEAWSNRRLQALQAAGVRCLRIHGKFGDLSDGTQDVIRTLKTLLLHASDIARRQEWAISMQLPIRLWAELEGYFQQKLAGIPIIAEHCASVNIPIAANDAVALESICRMLEKGLLYVKLGALHRRKHHKDGINNISPVLSKIAQAGPTRLLWGSDWPHVDSTARGMTEAPFLNVDGSAELEAIKKVLIKNGVGFDDLLVTTPSTLFL